MHSQWVYTIGAYEASLLLESVIRLYASGHSGSVKAAWNGTESQVIDTGAFRLEFHYRRSRTAHNRGLTITNSD